MRLTPPKEMAFVSLQKKGFLDDTEDKDLD